MGKAYSISKTRLYLLIFIGIVVCLLAASFIAELHSGIVSNLLAPLYGAARSNLDGDIGRPLGAAVTADGYVLTVDAVLRDDDNDAIVYTLTRSDGQPIPDDVAFEQFGCSANSELKVVRVDSAPNQVKLVETKPHTGIPLGRIVTASFSDMVIKDDKGTTTSLLAEGPWEFTFVMRYKNAAVHISEDIEVQGELGNRYTVNKLVLSPLKLHIDLTAPVPSSGEDFMEDFSVEIRLKDGTAIPIGGFRGGGWNDEDATTQGELDEDFELPVFLSDIESFVICNTDIEIR